MAKLWQKLASMPSLKDYESDKNRSASKAEQKIVISRHLHDVAGMSTNQGWTSCMNLDSGLYKENVPEEVKHGTHVAYLVHKHDHKAEKPIARIALKPYINDQGKKILRPENKTYGTSNSNFHKTVSLGLISIFQQKTLPYQKHTDVYDDGGPEAVGTGILKFKEGNNYYKNGKLHRDGDLPAVESGANYKEYYKNGKNIVMEIYLLLNIKMDAKNTLKTVGDIVMGIYLL